MDVVSKITQFWSNPKEIEALRTQFSQNMVVFRSNAHMRYRSVHFFATNRPSRDHAAAVALRDRFSLIHYCHRRTSCPTNSKSPWYWLPLLFLHALNKKSQWKYLQLSQSQQHLSTNTSFAGRGTVLAHAILPFSDRRRVTC